MAKNHQITLKIEFKWWLKYLYFPTLRFFIWFIVNFVDVEAEPNTEAISKIIKAGTRFKHEDKII